MGKVAFLERSVVGANDVPEGGPGPFVESADGRVRRLVEQLEVRVAQDPPQGSERMGGGRRLVIHPLQAPMTNRLITTHRTMMVSPGILFVTRSETSSRKNA